MGIKSILDDDELAGGGKTGAGWANPDAVIANKATIVVQNPRNMLATIPNRAISSSTLRELFVFRDMPSAIVAAEPVTLQGPLGFIAPPEIGIECPAFTGTLGTLVRCVLQQKIDLWDIPLHPICVSYVEYLLQSNESDVDGAATALVAMAYLLERKAFRLIPLPETESTDDWDELYEGPVVADFREALLALEERFEHRQDLFFRTVEGKVEYELPIELGKVTTDDLARALQRLLEKATETPDLPFGKPRRSLADQMKLVLRCLGVEPRPLEMLVEGEFSRVEALWWFLALLELIRLGQASASLSEGGTVLFWRTVIEG